MTINLVADLGNLHRHIFFKKVLSDEKLVGNFGADVLRLLSTVSRVRN